MSSKLQAKDASDQKSLAWNQDRQHVLHPFQHFASFDVEGSLVIQKGEGCYSTDDNGKRKG